MKTAALLVLTLAATSFAACGSAGTDDALLGTWARMRADTNEVRDQYTFKADGTMTFDENKPDARAEEDHLTGPYTVADGVVVATLTSASGQSHERATFTYYADGAVFSPYGVKAPAGHQGIVGVWTGSIKLENLDDPSAPAGGANVTRDFRADGTFRWTSTPHDGSAVRTYDGTWVAESADTFRTVTADAAGSTNVIRLVADEALIPDGSVWQRE